MKPTTRTNRILETFDIAQIRSRLEGRFRRVGFDLSDAQDMTQQCFLILIERLHRDAIDDPSLADRFLFGVANLLIVAGKKRSRELEWEEMDGFSSSTEGPESATALAEASGFLFEALHKLARCRDRIILEKYYLLDEDLATMSQDLEIPKGTLKVALHRARNRLKTEFTRLTCTRHSPLLPVVAE